MTNHTRTLFVFLGGFMAGGLTASIVPWPAFPKAVVVAAVAIIVALTIGFVTRSVAPRKP